MRMDLTRGKPASHWVNTLSELELANAFKELGDEEDADRIARSICHLRSQQPIVTTEVPDSDRLRGAGFYLEVRCRRQAPSSGPNLPGTADARQP